MDDGASHVTNYYLPKTAGWGAIFAGRPAVPVLFTYTTNSGVITINKYIGIWGSVVVPDSLNGLLVMAIANTAFCLRHLNQHRHQHQHHQHRRSGICRML